MKSPLHAKHVSRQTSADPSQRSHLFSLTHPEQHASAQLAQAPPPAPALKAESVGSAAPPQSSVPDAAAGSVQATAKRRKVDKTHKTEPDGDKAVPELAAKHKPGPAAAKNSSGLINRPRGRGPSGKVAPPRE